VLSRTLHPAASPNAVTLALWILTSAWPTVHVLATVDDFGRSGVELLGRRAPAMEPA